MNRSALGWIVAAIAVLGLAVVTLLIGVNLVPSRTVAQAKGTFVPWLLVWGMTWGTALMAVFLAGFLASTGLKTARQSG